MWFRPGGGVRDTNGGMGGGIVKMNHDKRRGSYFRDTPNGPPTSWVSPRVSPSPIPPSNDNKPPTSPCSQWMDCCIGKGRGGCGSILACEGAVALMEPTSLNGGEGLAGRQATLDAEGARARVVVERWW